MPFILIFLILPFIELMIFAHISEIIGIWTALSLALITAIIGGGLVKYQGLQTLFSLRQSLERGDMPLAEIFDGVCIVAAGALLITPGFLTDGIGFALLVPNFRGIARSFLARHTQFQGAHSSSSSHMRGHSRMHSRDHTQGDIEGEYERVDED